MNRLRQINNHGTRNARRSMCRSRLMLAALESRIAPAIYVVDALTDTGAGAGLAGDLRYCITQANANAGVDSIDATGLVGTILLGAELPTITDDLAIHGPGAKLLDLDGQLGTRLLQISTTGGKQVDFSDLKFTNGGTTGNGGVVLVNNATATFSNCVLNNSFANVGGLVAGTASSIITILNCTLSGSSATAGGGAVYSAGGTLSIRNSTLSGNNTGPFGSGGAVLVGAASAATVINSTLSGNTAGAHGGAIRTSSGFTGQLRVRNTTITQNSVVSSTGTGRGVSVGGAVIIDSTIVAQNTGGAGSTSDVSGTIQAGYSLFGTTDAATITGNGNFKGTNMSPVNAKLGPLADNGGPTLTHMPADDSPVREGGVDQDAQTEDQRGFGYARLENYANDIGAVETLNFKPMAANIDVVVDEPSPNTTFQFTVTYFDPRGSMLVDYSSLGTGDLYIPGPNGYFEYPTFISATPGADAQSIVATYEIPVPANGKAGWDVSDNGIYALIASPNEVFDKDTPTPSAGDTVAFAFLICDIADVYIVDEASDVVDMKYGFGELSFREAVLLSNTDGKASKIKFSNTIFAGSSTISMTGGEYKLDAAVTIIGPSAPLTLDAGGTSRVFRTTATAAGVEFSISDLTLANGSINGDGGGIFFDAGKLNLDHVTITNCQSTNYGGGIYAKAAGVVVSLTDSQVTNNSTKISGGGIFLNGDPLVATGRLNLVRSTIADNSSTGIGAGIAINVGGFSISDCALTGNVAGNGIYSPRGGAIDVNSWATKLPTPQYTIRNSTLSNNVAYEFIANTFHEGYGGAIAFFQGPATLGISNSTIVNNSTGFGGGGLHILSQAKLNLSSSIVAGNSSVTGPPDISYSGTIQGTNNLIGIADVGDFTLQPGNLSGTKAAPLDAKVGSLADNGGPTMTHALLPGSPAINGGSNTAGLLFDQRGTGFARNVNGAVDIGAFEVQATPAKIVSVQINDGSAQRSRVTSLVITFDSAVTLPANPADAFQLKRQDNAVVTLNVVPSGNSVTLTFTGGPVEFTSLTDGRYTLTALATEIDGGFFDGDGDGTAGDNYVLASTLSPSPATNIFRFFGDHDGDGNVAANDFIQFRLALGGNSPIFDYDNDGAVAASDFIQFRLRFGGSI